MNLIDDFYYVWPDVNGVIPAPYKEMTHLRYSLIGTGPELFIPLRWDTFYDYEDSTVIDAVLDRPVGGFTELSVLFDHTKRVSSVELCTEYGSTRHKSWEMSHDLRGELFNAVRFLTLVVTNRGVLRVWKAWEKNFEIMETL